jgi:hypothetical protein
VCAVLSACPALPDWPQRGHWCHRNVQACRLQLPQRLCPSTPASVKGVARDPMRLLPAQICCMEASTPLASPPLSPRESFAFASTVSLCGLFSANSHHHHHAHTALHADPTASAPAPRHAPESSSSTEPQSSQAASMASRVAVKGKLTSPTICSQASSGQHRRTSAPTCNMPVNTCTCDMEHLTCGVHQEYQGSTRLQTNTGSSHTHTSTPVSHPCKSPSKALTPGLP